MTYLQKVKRLELLRKEFEDCKGVTKYSNAVYLEILSIVKELNKIDKQVEVNTLPIKLYTNGE